jgi:hypothetical protein
MEQPAAAPPPAQPPASPPPVPPKGIDVAQIKTMLNLPETATDIELITSLVELIANLQQKYDALLSDAVTLEDKLANRDLEFFDKVVPAETKEFWREQLLANREGAVKVLEGMKAAPPPALAPAKPAEPAQPPRVPLRNRLVDQPKSIADLSGDPPPIEAKRATAIRNRAHELRKSEQVPWGEAFARAEKEIQ